MCMLNLPPMIDQKLPHHHANKQWLSEWVRTRMVVCVSHPESVCPPLLVPFVKNEWLNAGPLASVHWSNGKTRSRNCTERMEKNQPCGGSSFISDTFVLHHKNIIWRFCKIRIKYKKGKKWEKITKDCSSVLLHPFFGNRNFCTPTQTYKESHILMLT